MIEAPEATGPALSRAVAAQLEWQLDLLRQRRDDRLAELDRQHDKIWDDYNRAVAALSTPLVKGWG